MHLLMIYAKLSSTKCNSQHTVATGALLFGLLVLNLFDKILIVLNAKYRAIHL